MTLRLSEKAEQDLDDIYVESVRLFGRRQAERYSDSLDECLLRLASHPLMGRERSELGHSIRVHPHANHAILYEVDQRDILVLRILFQRSDWLRLM